MKKEIINNIIEVEEFLKYYATAKDLVESIHIVCNGITPQTPEETRAKEILLSLADKLSSKDGK